MSETLYFSTALILVALAFCAGVGFTWLFFAAKQQSPDESFDVPRDLACVCTFVALMTMQASVPSFQISNLTGMLLLAYHFYFAEKPHNNQLYIPILLAVSAIVVVQMQVPSQPISLALLICYLAIRNIYMETIITNLQTKIEATHNTTYPEITTQILEARQIITALSDAIRDGQATERQLQGFVRHGASVMARLDDLLVPNGANNDNIK